MENEYLKKLNALVQVKEKSARMTNSVQIKMTESCTIQNSVLDSSLINLSNI